MAQFSLEIADEDINRVLDAVAANYNRVEKINNPNFDDSKEVSIDNPEFIDNPENKYQFANRKVREFLAEHVKAFEIAKAKKTASEQVLSVSPPIINDPQL